jgi:integrase
MAIDLSKVGERARLKAKPGKAPHYQRLRDGTFLGFRPDSQTWTARARDDSGKYLTKSLGDYGALPGNDKFGAARRDAEAWADKVQSGGVTAAKIETVSDACKSYLDTVHDRNGIAAGVFRRHVYADPLGSVKLDKLRRHHLRDWRKRLEGAPAAVTRDKAKSSTKERAKSTVNRDMVPLRAALRRVLPAGAPGTDAAWQEALLPFRSADGRRTLYLDKGERRRLVDAAPADAAPFLQGLCLLPLRPGALAALTAAQFDKRTRTLTIGTDKTGHARRITLPPVTAEFIAKAAKDKLPGAFLFSIRQRHEWAEAIKHAADAAKLPAATCAYTLRHSTITDLVLAGLPLLQVAQISGTSAAMIERHYGHLVSDAAEAALAKLA